MMSAFLILLLAILPAWGSKYSLQGFHLRKSQQGKKIEIHGEAAKGFLGLEIDEIDQPSLDLVDADHRFTLQGKRGALEKIEELLVQGKGSAHYQSLKNSQNILDIDFSAGDFAHFHLVGNMLRVSRATVRLGEKKKVSGNSLVVDFVKHQATFQGAADDDGGKHFKPRQWSQSF
jgi:hypothetical protein